MNLYVPVDVRFLLQKKYDSFGQNFCTMVSCIAIDDDPLFLKMITTYFHDIRSAKLIGTYTNPVEGMLAVVKLKPEVVLLDLDMPYLDGMEALETLDKIPKIIVISGVSTPEVGSLDISKFLTKPQLTSPGVLEEAIRNVL